MVTAEIADMFKALGDPTRLAIFEFIRSCGSDVEVDVDSGECCRISDTCVGDICCRFDIASSTVSHHLKELRQAGLIQTERRGRWVYVTVREEDLRRIRRWAEAEPAAAQREARSALPGA